MYDPARPQCAGAAMYRDLVGIADVLPPALARLPGNAELVFASHAEMLAHHEGCTVEEAEVELLVIPPERHLVAELRDTRTRVVKT